MPEKEDCRSGMATRESAICGGRPAPSNDGPAERMARRRWTGSANPGERAGPPRGVSGVFLFRESPLTEDFLSPATRGPARRLALAFHGCPRSRASCIGDRKRTELSLHRRRSRRKLAAYGLRGGFREKRASPGYFTSYAENMRLLYIDKATSLCKLKGYFLRVSSVHKIQKQTVRSIPFFKGDVAPVRLLHALFVPEPSTGHMGERG